MSKKEIKKVYLNIERSGLANRLRALVGAIAFAEINDAQFILNWVDKDHACPGMFDEIFEPHSDIVLQTGTDLHVDVKDPSVFEVTDRTTVNKFWERNVKDNYSIKNLEYQGIALKYGQSLRPIKEIRDRVTQFTKDNLLCDDDWCSRSVGLHIRRTDLKEQARITDEDYKRVIDIELNMFPYTKIFLAADNKATEELFKDIDDRILVYEKVYNNVMPKGKIYLEEATRTNIELPESYPGGCRHRHTTVVDAAIDMYILSRCSKVIGSHSSFGRFAAWIGEKPFILSNYDPDTKGYYNMHKFNYREYE